MFSRTFCSTPEERHNNHYNNNTGSHYNNTDSHYNNTDPHSNDTGSHYNNTGSHYNNTGSHYNNTGSYYNNTGSHYNNTGSYYGRLGLVRKSEASRCALPPCSLLYRGEDCRATHLTNLMRNGRLAQDMGLLCILPGY